MVEGRSPHSRLRPQATTQLNQSKFLVISLEIIN